MKNLLLSLSILLSGNALAKSAEVPDYRLTCEQSMDFLGLADQELGATRQIRVTTLRPHFPEYEESVLMYLQKDSQSLYDNSEGVVFTIVEIVPEGEAEQLLQSLSQWKKLILQSSRWSRVLPGRYFSYANESCSFGFFENIEDQFPKNYGKEIGRFVRDGVYLTPNRENGNSEYPLLRSPMLLEKAAHQ